MNEQELAERRQKVEQLMAVVREETSAATNTAEAERIAVRLGLLPPLPPAPVPGLAEAEEWITPGAVWCDSMTSEQANALATFLHKLIAPRIAARDAGHAEALEQLRQQLADYTRLMNSVNAIKAAHAEALAENTRKCAEAAMRWFTTPMSRCSAVGLGDAVLAAGPGGVDKG